MPFYSGTATSYADLLTALTDACVANGWSWSDSILSKGAAFIKLTVGANGITLQGGTGKTGATLDGASPITPRLGRIHATLGNQGSFPMTYSIHLFSGPDEVFLVARHSVDYFFWSTFGVSNVPGVGGTGLWYGAVAMAAPETYSSESSGGIYIGPTHGGFDSFSGGISSTGALFWKTSNNNVSKSQNSLHCAIDGITWADQPSSASITAVGKLQAIACAAPHVGRQPSAWNSEAVLLPIQAYLARASTKLSLVADLVNARYVRVDNYAPEQIITLGADQWKIYPFYRKESSMRDGITSGGMIDHTGTFGWAIRYDGA